jgi:hypothetical protein
VPVSQEARSVGPEMAQSYAGLSAVVDTVDLPDASFCLGKGVILNILGPVSAKSCYHWVVPYCTGNIQATLYARERMDVAANLSIVVILVIRNLVVNLLCRLLCLWTQLPGGVPAHLSTFLLLSIPL